MENLNDLIWTDEEENEELQSTLEKPMVKLCMVAFCGNDTAGTNYSCYQDRPMRTSACV